MLVQSWHPVALNELWDSAAGKRPLSLLGPLHCPPRSVSVGNSQGLHSHFPQLSALPAPGPPKCPQVLGTSLPLGEWFPWNPSFTWGSEICGAAACLDHGPLGPGAEAWSVWVLCLSPYLHGALTPRPWRSGWFVISLHRERVQTPHQTSSCFMAAGLRRPWPCCLLLPGVHSNSLLLVILWTSGIFVC